MNKRYCFFCVGTGGHVFPAKNIILQLLKSGVSEEDIIIITDKRGVKYFEDLNIERIQKDFFSSSRGIFGYVPNVGQFIKTAWQLFNRLKSKNINTILTTGAYIATICCFNEFVNSFRPIYSGTKFICWFRK